MEKWKSKSRIPTFPSARFPVFKPKKGGLAADRFAPAFRLILRENQNRRSGSFFDENMLTPPSQELTGRARWRMRSANP